MRKCQQNMYQFKAGQEEVAGYAVLATLLHPVLYTMNRKDFFLLGKTDLGVWDVYNIYAWISWPSLVIRCCWSGLRTGVVTYRENCRVE